ncbi:MAG: hypothetical protein QOJ69_921 [Actinomycetota bacterium]|nr:hypothetical protein [Actinomycetota bacterium]
MTASMTASMTGSHNWSPRTGLELAHRTARVWGVLAIVLVLGVLTSCSSATGAYDTTQAMLDAGFADASVDFNSSDGFDEVHVTADPGYLERDGDSLAETAAGVVWTNFPLQFDDLQVTLTGPLEGFETFFTYDELYELFGPRPAGFDERSIGDDFARTGLVAAIFVGGGLLLFVAVAAVTIVLIVRASRRRKAMPPPSWPPGSPTSQWGASEWPPSSQRPPSQWPPPTQSQPPTQPQPPSPSGWGRPPDGPDEPGGPASQSWPPPPQ